MVGYWSNLSSFDIMSYLVVDFTYYWIPFDDMFMIELIWVFTYPSEVFQLVCHCLPYSPFQWPFHPNLGLWFLTSLMRFFHKISVLICLLGQEPYSQGFPSHYLSIWSGFGSCDFSTTPWFSPYLFLPQTQWIDMILSAFPPWMSHEPMFQILAQSIEEIQSY